MFLRPVIAVAATLAAAAAFAAGTAAAHPTPSLPCRWHWSLNDGLPAGKVVGGLDVDCRGYSGGVLVLRAKLFRWNPQDRRWRRVAASTRRWRNFRARNWVEVVRPCVDAFFRAEFRAVLQGRAAGLSAGCSCIPSVCRSAPAARSRSAPGTASGAGDEEAPPERGFSVAGL
jgi:hypothetical protein